MLVEQRLEAVVRGARVVRRKCKPLTGEIRRLINQRRRREGRVRPRRGEAGLETFRGGNCSGTVRGHGVSKLRRRDDNEIRT